ncbi:MAG TPA: NAD-dependent DNA ligase LigA [Gemmatimonadales bacterium]
MASNLSSIRRRVEALRRRIQRHDYLYHVADRPEIADRDYDRLLDALKALEAKYPSFMTGDSPTQRVGGRPRKGFETRPHTHRMLSVDSTRERADVERFLDRLASAQGGPARCILQPKLDGVSVELVYRNGRLAWATTRGDGVRGELVTDNVRTVRSVPLRLHEVGRTARRQDGRGGAGSIPPQRQIPARLAVRGEILLPLAAFEKVNRRLVELGEEPFANPRNAAAGSLRQLDPRITAERPLQLVTYEIMDVSGGSPTTESEAIARLRGWGFPTPEPTDAAETLGAIERYHRRLERGRERLGFEIDGIVVKAASLALRRRLGATSHHPRWVLAWKFEPRVEVTRVEDIVVQVGRTGLLTPVALLRPVDVSGVTVSRATLHNAREVARRDIRRGDTVRIHRAGDVIPEVVERVRTSHRRGGRFRMPDRCPACRARLVVEGAFTRCPNRLGCPAQLVGQLAQLTSREAFDLTGFGPRTLSALVERRLVREPADLFRLEEVDLLQLDGVKSRLATRLAHSLRERRRISLDRFLFALGIPDVGRATSRDLAQRFGSLRAVLSAKPAEFRRVQGLGDRTARKVAAFLKAPATRRAITRLRQAGVQIVAAPRPAGRLKSERVVFTGELEGFTRAEAEDLVRGLGGTVASVVTSNTTLVVAGRDPGRKLGRAQELGVTVVGEGWLKKQGRGKRD